MILPTMLRTLDTEGSRWVSLGHFTKTYLCLHPLHLLLHASQTSRKCELIWKFIQLAGTSLKAVPLLARLVRMCVKFSLPAHCVSFLHEVKIQTHFHLHFTLSFYWQWLLLPQISLSCSFLHTTLTPVRLDYGGNALKQICKTPRRVFNFKGSFTKI